MSGSRAKLQPGTTIEFTSPDTRLGQVRSVAVAFGKLGLLSFGGPVAHLAYFQNEFVQRRKWLTDAEYADLVALCQFLPGPASSQAAFAIGMKRARLLGAIVASMCFTLPSAILMIAFAYGVSSIANVAKSGWVHGLKLAAVAVVAHAVWQMGRKLCPDVTRLVLAGMVAAIVLTVAGAFVQIATIALGGALGWIVYRRASISQTCGESFAARTSRRLGEIAVILFGVLLIVMPMVVRSTDSRAAAAFDSFYRAGSLVFGGGHVVLPLLREEVVPKGWVSDDEFLAGYGAAQALPGPLFTFAGYVGTMMGEGAGRWIMGVLCLVAIFLPAWLLIAGAWPFWQLLREKLWAQAALRGANAAVVGLLLAALWKPVIAQSVHDWRDAVAAVIALGLLSVKVPVVCVVAALALAGQMLL